MECFDYSVASEQCAVSSEQAERNSEQTVSDGPEKLRTAHCALLTVGDILRVPFRNRSIPALIIKISETSPFAARAITIEQPEPLLHLGEDLVQLLALAARHSFTSQPSVLASWIKTLPKRLKTTDERRQTRARQGSLPMRTERLLVDRWYDEQGLIVEAKRFGRGLLIVTPWQHRAVELGEILEINALTSETPTGKAWKMIQAFKDEGASLVTTRVGAWLACFAESVILDEPENDDHKQDELSPRLDARWVVESCARLHPQLNVLSFASTTRLEEGMHNHARARQEPTIEASMSEEPWTKRASTEVETLSPQSIQLAEEQIEKQRSVFIIHPIKGERTRISCRDCGWTAKCSFCDFPLSPNGATALCKRCGRKGASPDTCPTCGGFDFSRGMPGKDRLAAQCKKHFNSELVSVIDLMELDALALAQRLPHDSLLVITDLALFGGASEDIRRKERILITWRRIASYTMTTNSHIHVQGSDELISVCRSWLTSEGVATTWLAELNERRNFGYPPAMSFVKLLVDGAEQDAQALVQDLAAKAPADWAVKGPYSVPFRSWTRKPRFAVHLVAPLFVKEEQLITFLEPVKKRALIDLDPIAFFS